MRNNSPDLEPPGTYRPQFRFKWRWLVLVLNRTPRLKLALADWARRALKRVFEPSIVTTERVIEYPFVFQNLNGLSGPVLDVGCCSSGLPISLASRGFRTLGLDFNPYPYRHPNFLAVRGDAMRSPFASGSFGAVLAVSVVEHIGIGHYHDPLAAHGDSVTVREFARILKPAGRLLLTVPFGRAMTDDFQRIYDPVRLRELLDPFKIERIEYAWSRQGLWAPCSEAEAASVDWRGTGLAVGLVVATPSGGS